MNKQIVIEKEINKMNDIIDHYNTEIINLEKCVRDREFQIVLLMYNCK